MLKLLFFYFNHCPNLFPVVINCSSWIGQINVSIIALSQDQCEKGWLLLVWREREQDSDLRLYLQNVIIYICKSSEFTAYPGQIHSVQFSHSVVSDSLQPHEPHHTQPPCPSTTPRVYSNSYRLGRWCHPTISSVVPFSSHLQSFPATESFQMSQFFMSGGQVLELQHQSFQWIFRTDFL